ncbi:MAG: carboxypeptidase-like regulatory domain-containing protein [Candidatus Brocadia sp.]
MGKKWIKLCLAGCIGIILGIAGAGSTPVYAKGKKLLALEGTVFDLKSSTSGLAVYGYVSDREKHPVEGAAVTIKSNKGGKGEGVTESSGFWGFGGLEDNATYTVEARKSGVGSKKTTFKIKKDEDENFIIHFKLKGVDE